MNIPGPVQVRISLCWPSPTRESSSPASQILFSFNAQPNIRAPDNHQHAARVRCMPGAGGQPPYIDDRSPVVRGAASPSPVFGAGRDRARPVRARAPCDSHRTCPSGGEVRWWPGRPRATIIVSVYRADGDGRMEWWRHPGMGWAPRTASDEETTTGARGRKRARLVE
jgi:hypothetical protein